MITAPEHTRFEIGQPVWFKAGLFCKEDPRTFIIVDFFTGFFQSLMAKVVPEDRINAIPEHIPVKYLTDQMPPALTPHADREGSIHFTATGRLIKAIDGGRK